jgi:hypothetical protein
LIERCRKGDLVTAEYPPDNQAKSKHSCHHPNCYFPDFREGVGNKAIPDEMEGQARNRSKSKGGKELGDFVCDIQDIHCRSKKQGFGDERKERQNHDHHRKNYGKGFLAVLFFDCFDLPFDCRPNLIQVLYLRFQALLPGHCVFLQIGFLFFKFAINFLNAGLNWRSVGAVIKAVTFNSANFIQPRHQRRYCKFHFCSS